METDAIIANCDLVITSDTSVAHLAGGLGKTTWLLLHKIPDWRWGLEVENLLVSLYAPVPPERTGELEWRDSACRQWHFRSISY